MKPAVLERGRARRRAAASAAPTSSSSAAPRSTCGFVEVVVRVRIRRCRPAPWRTAARAAERGVARRRRVALQAERRLERRDRAESVSSCHESSSHTTAGTSAPAPLQREQRLLHDPPNRRRARRRSRSSIVVEPAVAHVRQRRVDELLEVRSSASRAAALVGLALAVLLLDALDLRIEAVDDPLVDHRRAHEDAESESEEHGNERDEVEPEVDHGGRGEPRRPGSGPPDARRQNQFVTRAQASQNIKRKPSKKTCSECEA